VAAELTAAGFPAAVVPGAGDPRIVDAFLLRNADAAETNASGFAGFAEGGSHVITQTNDGTFVGLAAGTSIDDFHVPAGHGHGHTLRLIVKPSLLRRRMARGPTAFGATTRTELVDRELAEIARLIDADAIRAIVDKYSGRDPAVASVTRNRHIRSRDMPVVVDALADEFKRIGGGRLGVVRHRFTMENGRSLENVIAELAGETDEVIVISAHLDSTAAGTYGNAYNP
jgi:hypothetical protein